jgi:hypothetical protein
LGLGIAKGEVTVRRSVARACVNEAQAKGIEGRKRDSKQEQERGNAWPALHLTQHAHRRRRMDGMAPSSDKDSPHSLPAPDPACRAQPAAAVQLAHLDAVRDL